MKDWLVKLAEQTKSEDEVLHDTLEALPPDVLLELSHEFDPSSRPSMLDGMQEKIAEARQKGIELAHEHGDELVKEAWIGAALAAGRALLPAAGRMLGGQAAKGGLKSMAGGMVRDAAKDMVVNGATKAIGSAVRPPQQAMQPATQGGFNYGKVAAVNWAQMGKSTAGFFHKNPGAAVTLAGAGVGALMAPRDPVTGEKQYLRGALIGGGVGAGANALSQGRIADSAKRMVTRQNNPLLGQGVRRHMIEAGLAERAGGGGAAKALASHAPASVPSEAYTAARGAAQASGSETQAAMQQVKELASTPPATAAGHAGRPNPSYVSPAYDKAHAGAQEYVEMGQLRNQMGHAPMPAPRSANQSLSNFKFRGAPGGNWDNVKVADEKRTDLDRARSWGRTGAIANGGAAALLHGLDPVSIGIASAAGYGAGRLTHRIAHGPATGKPIEKKANAPALTFDPATKTFQRPQQVMPKMAGVLGEAASFVRKNPKAVAGAAALGVGGYAVRRHIARKDAEIGARRAMAKQAGMGAPGASMFSMKTNPSRVGGMVRGMMGGGAAPAAKPMARAGATPPIPTRAAGGSTPPPIPAAAAGRSQFAASVAGPSPFAAAPRQAPAQRTGAGLAGVQNQLNSAQSIAGGGATGTAGFSTVRAMPGSGW